MRILVTGSAGCVGQVVVPKLCKSDWVSEVIGLDVKPSSFAHPKFRFIQSDIRSSEALPALPGVDVLVHLAFAIARGELSAEEMRANNVDGSVSIIRAAADAGIPRVVNLSSVSVYGAGLNLSEDAPLAPLSTFPYSQHKAEVEQQSDRLHRNVIHLRAHFIAGAHAHFFLRTLAQLPFHIRLKRPAPQIQVVHEEDVADAIIIAIRSNARGPFNIAAAETTSLQEFVSKGKRISVPIPIGVPRFITKVVKTFTSPQSVSWLDSIFSLLENSLTVKCERAETELGWRPRRTTWDARRAMKD